MNWASSIIAKHIKNGKVVCFAVDTVYAIASDAKNLKAINLIYKIKQRNIHKPIAMFVPNISHISLIANINKKQLNIIESMQKYPITWILEAKKNNTVLPFYTKKTIAIRLPISELTKKVMEKINSPMMATSMNLSGRKPISKLKEMQSFLPKDCKIIVCKNLRPTGKASQIIDIRNEENKKTIRK